MQNHMAQWKAEGKRVAMYSTGGIRCEKTSARLMDPGCRCISWKAASSTTFKEMPDAERDW